ncbi:MAG: hypothetical protein IJ785_04190 [Bacteroidales bacterium]|nr:hypothetical protein [Bacteroidales bacterium]
MRRFVFWGILLATFSLTAGCSVIAKAAFGIDEIKEYREERVQSFLAESQRKVPCRQIIATVEQQDNLIRLDHDTTMMQHRAQPVQVLYFDGDSLIFYHINCYTQSSSNFLRYDWNNKGSFDRFPPSPTVVPDWHGRMTLTEYRRCLPGLASGSRYTILILWNNMLRKVSAKAVEAVAANVKGREDCTVWLVNTDQWIVEYINKQRTE